MKIGKLVKDHIPKIFQYCETEDLNELQWLMDKDYSKKTFNINYSFCKELSLISEKEIVRFWKDNYKFRNKIFRICSQWNIGHKDQFLNYLLSKRIITKEEYIYFQKNVQHITGMQPIEEKVIGDDRDFHIERNSTKDYPSEIDNKLRDEAQKMSENYEIFYGVERSIRMLVVEVMQTNYGENWWESKVDFRVKENVTRNLEYELDSPHTKRSERKIDYTTFGDLRKIINSNWKVFESKFKRNLNSVNEIMIDLNRIRVSIAHCTPLVPKEIKRLEIRVDDWFEVLKK